MTLEKIIGYTVGIAVKANTGVGTGILVANGLDRYILAAAHVDRDRHREHETAKAADAEGNRIYPAFKAALRFARSSNELSPVFRGPLSIRKHLWLG